jgi:hypothetical protein
MPSSRSILLVRNAAVGVLALASTAGAQVLAPHTTAGAAFASRSGLAPQQDGWIFERYAFDRQGGGIGSGGITQIAATLQKQDCSVASVTQLAIYDQVRGTPTTPIAPGSLASVPDTSLPLYQTALFNLPAGGPTVCAWTLNVSLGNQPLPGCRFFDLFVGALLSRSVLVNGNDALLAQINLGFTEGANATTAQPARTEIDREYATTMLAATTGAPVPNPATLAYPTPGRMHRFWIGYEHVTHTGAQLTAGQPPLFGWAGDYPDANDVGNAPVPRFDELAWRGEHSTLFGPNVIGSILLATRTLRSVPGFGAPLDLGTTGCLELDPSDPLFLATLNGAVPGLRVNGLLNPVQLYLPTSGIQTQTGLPALLHASAVDLYAQELRFNLVSGRISLGSLDTHSFR